MSDAMDIMGVTPAAPVNEGTPTLATLRREDAERSQRASPAAKTPKVPMGVAREVYRLTGGVAPLAPLTDTFKERPTWGSKKVAKWELRSIQSPLQPASLEVLHWERAADPVANYPYARQNTEAVVPQYTNDEYTAHFANDDAWTREETDKLFALCRRFDLRFALIADRWDGIRPRSIEDLRARYYSIQSTLVGLRNDVSDPAVQELLTAYSYDKDRETERKAMLDVLQRRTAQQIREEEQLILESRRIEAQSKRVVKDRQNVVRLLAAVDASLVPSSNMRKQSAVALSQVGPSMAGGLGSMMLDGKNKKKKKGNVLRVGSDAGSPTNEDIETDDISRRRDRLPIGASLRSSRLLASTATSKLAKRLEACLEELGVPVRPQAPTALISTRFEDLRQDLLTLLDLKKHTDRKEYEVKVLQHRKSILKGEASEPPAAFADPYADDQPSRKRSIVTSSPRLGGDLKRRATGPADA